MDSQSICSLAFPGRAEEEVEVVEEVERGGRADIFVFKVERRVRRPESWEVVNWAVGVSFAGREDLVEGGGERKDSEGPFCWF